MFEGRDMSGVTRRRYSVRVGEGGRKGCPLTAEIWCKHIERDWWEVGSPGGQSSECFSKNFLPSYASLMSCSSSGMARVPVLQVLGHVAVCEFGLSISLSVLLGGLFLEAAVGGMVVGGFVWVL